MGIGLKLADFFHHRGYGVPAGICATFAVALTPLAIYGLQRAIGLWPGGSLYHDYHDWIRWHWLFMELGTLAVGAIAAWRYRYPFLGSVITSRGRRVAAPNPGPARREERV